jgi:hypothetical protein
MKIFIYLTIAVIIYIYILQKNIYVLTNLHHIYFWSIIATILLIIYLMKYHKYHVYKFLQNMKDVDKKPYYN